MGEFSQSNRLLQHKSYGCCGGQMKKIDWEMFLKRFIQQMALEATLLL
jgi:hypothetical protein